ncbi:MAG TPA: hypothetical protein VFV87_08095 [Pirellulaceae bacterium]|nr:hypothetical protein [Pirellulaceae bacterium]
MSGPKLYKWVYPLALRQLPDGWWLDAAMVTPDVPLWGPYHTKREAAEARDSYLKGHPEVKKRKVECQ